MSIARVLLLAIPSLVALGGAACTVANPAAGPGGTAGSGSTAGTQTGTGDTQGTGSGTSGTSGADMGPGACAPTGTCMPAAPIDWLGPFAILEGTGDMPASCPDGWGQDLLVAWKDLTVPASTCECTCEAPQGVTCGDTSLVQSSSNSCNILVKSWPVGASCTNVSAKDGQAQYWTASQPDVAGGSCTATPTTVIPPTSWGAGVVACAPMEQAGACAEDGQSCVGLPDASSRLCIAVEGDEGCPAGTPYQTRELLYRNVADDRGCAACTCGDPAGTCTGAKVRLVDASDCNAGAFIVGTVPADGSCEQITPGPAQGAKLDTTTATIMATCEPSAAAPTGEATPADPVTLCCL